jgi:hypothetical protein
MYQARSNSPHIALSASPKKRIVCLTVRGRILEGCSQTFLARR